MLDSIKIIGLGLEAALVTMNVSLTPELEKFVNDKVKTGLYNSASEVVRESLRLLRRQDELETLQLDELRREIRSGIEQMDAGEGVPIDAVRERIKHRRSKGR
ncbi:type II toxin-antitoxin system ParD family antitoxin [Candidatus Obscuribacterales bacterium]|nr:type II toxin-antitoxin system ParD family antitoxin [Candidatus Obscuribacterales bacterium]MBX3152784.1 type II toxin-antitoxin system ParD family antitoxin [Candidatus Obscuribacterales bacterium]